MKRKDAKEHSTTYKVGGLGLETLWRVSKNFPTELSVKYSTVHVLSQVPQAIWEIRPCDL